ncbi:carbonic anhydrase/acetyltransferase-like protein (isoleucine patch superfamily) [Actinoplanes lutulentus]|uniref:Carbonic anhydrase/acetyltransferase-like protein (Isoleucine patch superfamily) n=1 Tax=Actinoplanes lutulentus TaxID=1287878 RepID=A0A327ZC92_9ACTN|nr:gamma carbonic anhydrase family protein [Actinoplanes lutulentus]MBB2946964.1 carbonic anhydrase/acetyltransferase-like protein (isoleucine patch superfamily) [Actinoplanes lutulentus]RAK30466.1 carbonic anhydrase/acetyltransferase-like protein (isoleucine patch superfamily) [Actinoplanes lutulentus]
MIEIGGHAPRVAPTAWVAPGAVVAGRVTLGADVSVWYQTVVRADLEDVAIGPGTNLQDGVVVHADPGFPVSVGSGVSVGHRAVLHGCTIEDDVLIGMGAIVMNGAHIGTGSIVAAGALVPEGSRIPAGSLVLGMPAKVRRPITEGERASIAANAEVYIELAKLHRQG